MNSPKRVLIIKTGFSEFLDRGISTTVSFGDVLMCTAILNLYKEDHVTWVTSFKGSPLLEENPYIDELMVFGSDALKKIGDNSYDVLINLEKDIGLCAYLSQIKAKRRYGFYFNEDEKDISTYHRSTRYLLSGQENHKKIRKSSLEILFEAIGKRWNKEGFVLGYKPKSKVIHDIGFNFEVGSKWPTKAWPQDKWEALEKLLHKKYSISWQKGQKDIYRYIDWIHSCKIIVTSDSLGQILGQVLGKKVVSLFGSTNHKRMEGIPGISVIASTLKCPHRPCYLSICKHDKFCMDYIEPAKVAAKCEELLAE